MNKVVITEDDVLELMELKGWSKADLASHLNLGQSAIDKWVAGIRPVTGAASVLIEQWLREAKEGTYKPRARKLKRSMA